MILKKREKIHVIHRRLFEKEPRRHFIGVVDEYEAGLVRATGHVFTVDTAKYVFLRRPEKRTRIMSLVSGELIVNVLPATVNLDKIVYKQEAKAVRVTDESDWYLDISEMAWM